MFVWFTWWFGKKNTKTKKNKKNLRLLATDGFFVPVPTGAEVLLLGSLDLLQSTHIGPVGGTKEKQVRGEFHKKRKEIKTQNEEDD